MTGKTGGNRGLWRAAALAVAAADVALPIRQDRRRDRGTGKLEAGS